MRGNAQGLGVFNRPGANAAIMDKSDGVREGYLRTPGRMKADPDTASAPAVTAGPTRPPPRPSPA